MMAFVPFISLGQATGSTKQLFDAVAEQFGGVPNIVRVMGHDGGSASAGMALYAAVMKSSNALLSRQKEMIAAVVSNVNDCFY